MYRKLKTWSVSSSSRSLLSPVHIFEFVGSFVFPGVSSSEKWPPRVGKDRRQSEQEALISRNQKRPVKESSRMIWRNEIRRHHRRIHPPGSVPHRPKATEASTLKNPLMETQRQGASLRQRHQSTEYRRSKLALRHQRGRGWMLSMITPWREGRSLSLLLPSSKFSSCYPTAAASPAEAGSQRQQVMPAVWTYNSPGGDSIWSELKVDIF